MQTVINLIERADKKTYPEILRIISTVKIHSHHVELVAAIDIKEDDDDRTLSRARQIVLSKMNEWYKGRGKPPEIPNPNTEPCDNQGRIWKNGFFGESFPADPKPPLFG